MTTEAQDPSEPSPADPLTALGWGERWMALAADSGIEGTGPDPVGLGDTRTAAVEPARVVRHDGSAVMVTTRHGTSHRHLGADLDPLATGDWVLADQDRVRHLLARHSLLQRRDPSTGGQQLIAANIDTVGVVCALDRPVTAGQVGRLTTIAWDSGAVPLIVLSKCDLAVDADEVERLARAAAPGVDVIRVSTPAGEGVDELRRALAGRTAVLLGSSGAGKSTLVNAIARTSLAATGEVRSGDHKGRHTTTARQLHVIGDDICLIDTPGVRELGLWSTVAAVDAAYDEIAATGRRVPLHRLWSRRRAGMRRAGRGRRRGAGPAASRRLVLDAARGGVGRAARRSRSAAPGRSRPGPRLPRSAADEAPAPMTVGACLPAG